MIDKIEGKLIRERPFHLSGPEVLAILDGRKTQARRVLKMPEGHVFDTLLRTSIKQDNAPPYALFAQALKEGTNQGTWIRCPYSDGTLGDRLWVREKLRLEDPDWTYAADGARVWLPVGDSRVSDMLVWAHHKEGRACSPSRMPRWASRLTLEVTEVRVERVQDISEADARAEGVGTREVPKSLDPAKALKAIPCIHCGARRSEHLGAAMACRGGYGTVWNGFTARGGFATDWDRSSHGKRAPWASNPWVWALTFRRVVDHG